MNLFSRLDPPCKGLVKHVSPCVFESVPIENYSPNEFCWIRREVYCKVNNTSERVN